MADLYSFDLTRMHRTDDSSLHKLEKLGTTVLDNTTNNSTEDNTTDSIEDRLQDEKFITPQEYYSKQGNIVTTDNTKQGFHDISNTGDKSDRKWFWVEDLKNWCSYRAEMNVHSSLNRFTLQVWNGKNDWIDLTGFYNLPDSNGNNATTDYRHSYYIDSAKDAYNIKSYQDKLINTLVFGSYDKTDWHAPVPNDRIICSSRGAAMAMQVRQSYKTLKGKVTNWDDATGRKIDASPVDYYYHQEKLLVVKGFKLQKAKDYTINMGGSFQTIRWSTVKYSGDDIPAVLFGQTNAVFYIPTGVPPVWRLPSGELFLATRLDVRGDNGHTYIYRKDETYGFRKVYDTTYLSGADDVVSEWRMMGDDDNAAANWINEVCAKFFTDGSVKTIEKDWLRRDDELITEDETIEKSVTSEHDMLDTGKIYEQNNINKENSFICKFIVNRPVVTTEPVENLDYAKKW